MKKVVMPSHTKVSFLRRANSHLRSNVLKSVLERHAILERQIKEMCSESTETIEVPLKIFDNGFLSNFQKYSSFKKTNFERHNDKGIVRVTFSGVGFDIIRLKEWITVKRQSL